MTDVFVIVAVVLALLSLVSIFAFWRWWGNAKWIYFALVAVLSIALYQHVQSLHP